jgi:enterochelin esterase family protein
MINCVILSLEAMLRYLTLTLALFTTPSFAQTPAVAQRPAMAEIPNTDIHYALAPDALVQDGVPKGEIRGPFTLPSAAYPGTQHTYWIYVPAQYDPATPASLMIYNDGQAFMAPEGDVRAQVVMDNLIYRREIPVMIGIFINPGRRPDQPEPTGSNWGDRDTNRPTEYNTLDDKYARVIVDEHFERSGAARHRRIELGRHRRVHSSVGAAGSFPQSAEQRRKLHQYSRGKCLSRYHSQEREEASACVPGGWPER